MHSLKSKIVLLIFAVMLAVVPTAHGVCSNATLHGVYGVLSTGLNGSQLPASSVNRVVLDGAGNLSGSATKSIDGTIVTFTFTGTYQIVANCTGSASFNNQDGTTINANIYLDNKNLGAFMIQTDDKHVETSVAVAQGTVTCTDLGVKHTYATQFKGTDLVHGQIAVGGQFKLNGAGSVTGTATLSIGGTIVNNAPVTGSYTINSDCTGTAQVTPQGLPAVNLALLVVNGGKEIMALQTDAGTIVAGTLQQ